MQLVYLYRYGRATVLWSTVEHTDFELRTRTANVTIHVLKLRATRCNAIIAAPPGNPCIRLPSTNEHHTSNVDCNTAAAARWHHLPAPCGPLDGCVGHRLLQGSRLLLLLLMALSTALTERLLCRAAACIFRHQRGRGDPCTQQAHRPAAGAPGFTPARMRSPDSRSHTPPAMLIGIHKRMHKGPSIL